jgi:GT2 family glycosyltransferase
MIESDWTYGGNVDELPIVTIVLCTMWRIKCLPWTLACLDSQREKRFSLVIWNNNTEQRSGLEDVVAGARPSFPVRILHSDSNCGGIGRFLVIRNNSVDMGRPVIFVDDDQVLFPGFVSTLLGLFRPDRVTGSWAWRFRTGGGYWDRERCPEGEEAHYIGTGGLIFDPNLSNSEDFFSELPEPYSRVEDLWLSFYASCRLRYKLIAAPVLARQVRDGKDQFPSLRAKKTEFLHWLRSEKGWRV